MARIASGHDGRGRSRGLGGPGRSAHGRGARSRGGADLFLVAECVTLVVDVDPQPGRAAIEAGPLLGATHAAGGQRPGVHRVRPGMEVDREARDDVSARRGPVLAPDQAEVREVPAVVEELLLLWRHPVGRIEPGVEEHALAGHERREVLVVPPAEEGRSRLPALQLPAPVLAVVGGDAWARQGSSVIDHSLGRRRASHAERLRADNGTDRGWTMARKKRSIARP